MKSATPKVAFVSETEKWRAMNAIKSFFDAVDLIATRLPGLERLIVELVLIGLAIVGACALFRQHPH